MKILLGILATLVLANAALACDSNPPPNCYCKNGQWYSNVTNTVYNNTTNNVVNGINGNVSAGAGATSTATGGTATGGSATANGGTNTNTLGQQQSLNNSGNNSSTSNASVAAGAVQNTVAGGAGGQGGQGGKGGKATIQTGAVQSSNSNVNNVAGGTSVATVAAGAVQNTVGSTSSVGNVGSTSSVGDVSTGASTSTATANGNGSGNGNGNSVNFEAAKTYRAPVATAYAASLTSGADTCLGSISGGAQTQILGLTIGGTKRDKGCDLIKQTHLLMELQQSRAACIRAQLKEEGALIKEAMKEAGAECPPLVTPVAEVPVIVPPSDAVTHAELRLIEDRITTKIVSK